MERIGDSLDRAPEGAFTRPAPKSAQAQMKYLVKQLKGTKAVAQLLGVSQGTVER
ncbi:XRE family transcriptional regulator, partial [Streptomyces sp. NPDC001093]